LIHLNSRRFFGDPALAGGRKSRLAAEAAGQSKGLRSRLLGRAVLSPLDLERENPDLIGGTAFPAAATSTRIPVLCWSRYATPIRNLDFCGASTWRGGGAGREPASCSPKRWRDERHL